MFPLVRGALGLSARSIRHTVTRQAHRKLEPDFHDKYGNLLFIGGITFCVASWYYALTQCDFVWSSYPVGRVTPKEWNENK